MTFKGFFSFRQNGFFWFNILAMIAVVLVMVFGLFHWLDVYTRHGEAVVVPDVKGMNVKEARKLFDQRKLVCQVADSTYRVDLVPGSILDYHPDAGQKVKEGRIIYLTINTLAVPLKEVPDVSDNSSLRQADARLMAAGFKVDSVEMVAGAKDWVYGVKYNGRLLRQGEQVPTGATLVLVAGNGQSETFDDDSLASQRPKPFGPDVLPGEEPQGESSTNEDPWF